MLSRRIRSWPESNGWAGKLQKDNAAVPLDLTRVCIESRRQNSDSPLESVNSSSSDIRKIACDAISHLFGCVWWGLLVCHVMCNRLEIWCAIVLHVWGAHSRLCC